MNIHAKTTDLTNNLSFDYDVYDEVEAAELTEQLNREQLKVRTTNLQAYRVAPERR